MDRRRRLEGLLFLSPQGISSRKAAKLASLADATEVRTLICQLNEIYDCQFKPYRIEEVAGGYAIMTRGRLSPWLRKLSYLPGEVRLGRSALETLAIIAYRQPVMRADIEAIRGVGSSEMLKQLMELDLVRISGRSEDLGRPYLYGTTHRFLQMFGLRSADRLPRIEQGTIADGERLGESPVDTIQPSSKTPFSKDFALDSEPKESTVKSTITVADFTVEKDVDDVLLAATANARPISAIDEDDDDWDEDDDDDWDDEDDDEEDDWEEDEEEEVGDEDDADDLEDELEEEAEEEEEEEEWEEVEDEDESVDEEEEDDDDDDWDDDEDDDDDWDEDEEEEDWE